MRALPASAREHRTGRPDAVENASTPQPTITHNVFMVVSTSIEMVQAKERSRRRQERRGWPLGGRFTPTGKARGYSQKGCDKATRGFSYPSPLAGMAKKRARQIRPYSLRPRVGRLPVSSPLAQSRGWRAKRRVVTDVVTYRFRHVAPLGAPSRRSHIRRRAALSAPGHGRAFRLFRRPALHGADRRWPSLPAAVSELLAGDMTPHEAPRPDRMNRTIYL